MTTDRERLDEIDNCDAGPPSHDDLCWLIDLARDGLRWRESAAADGEVEAARKAFVDADLARKLGDSHEIPMRVALTAATAWHAANAPKLRRYRHKKRGTECVVIGSASLQTEKPLCDYAGLVVYREDDGKLWARPLAEFGDGRFEEIDLEDVANAPKPADGEVEALKARIAELEAQVETLREAAKHIACDCDSISKCEVGGIDHSICGWHSRAALAATEPETDHV
jgi:hypothetical protein